MKSQILPRRTNAMCIHQVAASEEFLPASSHDDVRPLESNMNIDLPDLAENTEAATPWESSIHSSLGAVGDGIQQLLTESMTAATGEITNELHTTVQRQIRKAIKQHLPELSRQLQAEANLKVTQKAEAVAERAIEGGLQQFQATVEKQAQEHELQINSLLEQIQQLTDEREHQSRANEEQRKVLVALVKKVGILEGQMKVASEQQSKIDQRLSVLEQPTDLDSQWQQLLDPNEHNESESAA